MSNRASWDALLESIRQDRRSGASALSRRAAEGLPRLFELLGEPDDQTALSWRRELRKLANCRPPIAALFNLARATADLVTSKSVKPSITDLARAFVEDVDAHNDRIVASAASLLDGHSAVLTISASSVVERCLVKAHESGRELTVCCLESRPGREGVELATRLASAGLGVSLGVDAAMSRLVQECDLVLVGGDTVSPTGLVHKLGTLGLALAASSAKVPIYALCGSEKFLPSAVAGWQLDGGPPTEVTNFPGDPALPAWNGYFDLTPLELLTGIVSETGPLEPARAAAYAAARLVHPWLVDLLERGSAKGGRSIV